MPKLPFPICKLRAAILNFLLISFLYFKSIVKNEFLMPKFSRIKVLVMVVAPQDQFYIETNLAYLLIYTLCSICSLKKIAQSYCSGNKAKFAYLPTQNTVP